MSTPPDKAPHYTRSLDALTNDDVGLVGGKNASLGEMIKNLQAQGVRVPGGFATTSDAYWAFIEANELKTPIREELARWDKDEQSLADAGQAIRQLIRAGEFPDAIDAAIRAAYEELCEAYEAEAVDVAVRSSATAEDLPEASFAGQQETYLNIRGVDDVLEACRKCYASLFTDRAISYRVNHGFDHLEVALSAGVQKMVRADKAGVMFTIDTETGFPDVAVIDAGWGLGEPVVKGSITPDQYMVYKPLLEDEGLTPIIGKQRGTQQEKMVFTDDAEAPTRTVPTTDEEQAAFVLTDDETLQLARWGVLIEAHYDRPMDIEWARDGESEELFILQARPETVQSRAGESTIKSYQLQASGERLVTGLSIGQSIATGHTSVIKSVDDIDTFEEGRVLVTSMTDPDWGPIMKKASGIVTDHGGRTSHAAIVSRELGIPAVVGTGNATAVLDDEQEVTLSCAEGDEGYVYEGALDFEVREADLEELPSVETRIMLNIASPAGALRWWRLPVRGVGLARIEYIVNNIIQIHPMALVRFDDLEDDAVRDEIETLTRGFSDKREYFVDRMARGIATIAASQYPEPVIVRTSDFKTNEYADLIGGEAFEPAEDNPMLGWRGASRYYHEEYRAGFALECAAIRRAREEMGFTNVVVMIPFCRTPEEADKVLSVMADEGLVQGTHDLEVYVMAELPSNIIQARDFAERFDGFSIGSNDLTQLVLGIDRDAERLADLFDERQSSVKQMITDVIERAHAADRPVGLCGQAPSDHPDFAAFLVAEGIDSISVTPDSVVDVIRAVAEAEAQAAA